MVYLDDRLPNHPKLLAAAKLLGGGEAGYIKALAGFVSLLCHAGQFLTDGFVSDVAISSMNHIADLPAIADQFVAAGLLERVDGGYQFHDWRQWNHKTARQIQGYRDRKREQSRARQAAYRARQKAN